MYGKKTRTKMFIKNYIAKLKGEFKGYNGQKFSKDLMAGTHNAVLYV